MSFLSPLPSAYANLSFLPSVFYYSTLFLPSMPHFLPFLSCPFLLSLLSFLSSCIPLLLSWLSYFFPFPPLFLTCSLPFPVFPYTTLPYFCDPRTLFLTSIDRPKNYLTTFLAQQVYCMFQIQLFWSFSNSEYRNVLSSYNGILAYGKHLCQCQCWPCNLQ